MNLRAAIERDILTERPATPESQTCFACGRSYSKPAPLADDSGPSRFCSVRCRDYFDNGGQPYDPQSTRSVLNVPLRDWVVVAGPPGTVGTRPYGNAQPMTVSGDGFLIPCRNCKREFISKGLRCCSPSCERAYCESIEIEKITAEVGMESTGYVKRRCEHCGNPLPRYVGEGKKRKQSTKRFCTSRCQQAAKKQAGITSNVQSFINPPQSVSDPSEVPVPQGVESRVYVPLDLVGGGSFRFSDASLDRSLRRAILDEELPPLNLINRMDKGRAA